MKLSVRINVLALALCLASPLPGLAQETPPIPTSSVTIYPPYGCGSIEKLWLEDIYRCSGIVTAKNAEIIKLKTKLSARTSTAVNALVTPPPTEYKTDYELALWVSGVVLVLGGVLGFAAGLSL